MLSALKKLPRRSLRATVFRTLAVAADVAKVAEPPRVVQRAMEEFGGVDILVNNAGRAHTGGLLQAERKRLG